MYCREREEGEISDDEEGTPSITQNISPSPGEPTEVS